MLYAPVIGRFGMQHASVVPWLAAWQNVTQSKAQTGLAHHRVAAAAAAAAASVVHAVKRVDDESHAHDFCTSSH